MEIRKFKDPEEFIYPLCQEQESHYNRSLEEYLRSLLVVFQKHVNERVSGDLIAQVLSEAFVTEPIEFDSSWLAYTKAYFA